MNFDKNTIIGFSLLGILLFGYFYFTSVNQHEYELQKRKIEDSIRKIESTKIDTVKTSNSIIASKNSLKSNLPQTKIIGVEELLSVENDDIKVVFSNKGAIPISVVLKNVVSFNKISTQLLNDRALEFNYKIKIPNKAETVESKDLFFNKGNLVKDATGKQRIEFIYETPEGYILKHEYLLDKKGFLFEFNINSNQLNAFFDEQKIKAKWITQLNQQENNLDYEKTQSQLTFLTQKGDFDYFNLAGGITETMEEPLKWISVKQQFFNQTLICEQGMNSAKNTTQVMNDTTKNFFALSQTDFEASFKSTDNILRFKYYFGPTQYNELKQYNLELERILNIGQGFYAFVKYINKFLVMPVFDFLKNQINNFGIVILLLTIFLRIITAPLLYTSYTSSAKMKILKPELDILKKKMGDDQQGYAMKQMELFKSAGVNPLGGCIPALLQIPIFLSLYYFFNACIDLRGQSFLWANDLSSFDSIYNFGFTIPFYGNHISLFTILNVITSFLISYTSMQNTPDQGNPMLKYMPYIFPVILLGFFNSLPSALTWYYTVSNVITLLLQFVIQKYIINHDKLLKQIDEKRKQPAKKSTWMQKVEEMQKAQKKLKELKK